MVMKFHNPFFFELKTSTKKDISSNVHSCGKLVLKEIVESFT